MPVHNSVLKCPRRGFTLTELLVVIAVIALLAAIMIPAIQAGRMSAYKAKSSSNMRQIGQAIQLFTQDNNGAFPLSTHTASPEESWIYTVADYLDDVDEVRICPADPMADERLENELTSYVLNEYVVVPNRDPLGNLKPGSYTNIYQLPNPSRTMVAFVCADDMAIGDHSDHTHSRGWHSWQRVLEDIQPNRFGSGSDDGLGGSANYLYADGHVENILAEDFKDMIVSGKNPADPSQVW